MEKAYRQFNDKALSVSDVQEIQEACAFLVKRYTHEEIWQETVDEIAAHPVEAAEKLRKVMNCGHIMLNRAKCLECGEFIESINRHHFNTCTCGCTSVDGGTWYLKRMWKDNSKGYMDTSENWPWIKYLDGEDG